MGYELLMQHFHTPAALAEALSAIGERISPQAIYKWKKKGIPLDRAPQIELASGGSIRCEEMCGQVLWTRSDDGQVIGYSVPVLLQEEPVSFQPCRVGAFPLRAQVSTANHKTP